MPILRKLGDRTVDCSGFTDYAFDLAIRTSAIAARRACAPASPGPWAASSDGQPVTAPATRPRTM